MRAIVLRNFLELLLPRVRQWRHTRLSVKWMKRVFICRWCSIRHLKLVKIARSSKELICSLPRVHFHPETTLHRHNLAGTLARNRWCLTSWVVGVVSKMSSPLMEIKLPNFRANSKEVSGGRSRDKFKGRRTKRPAAVTLTPGLRASRMSCAEWGTTSPNCCSRLPSSHATTGTLQLFPIKVKRTSL